MWKYYIDLPTVVIGCPVDCMNTMSSVVGIIEDGKSVEIYVVITVGNVDPFGVVIALYVTKSEVEGMKVDGLNVEGIKVEGISEDGKCVE